MAYTKSTQAMAFLSKYRKLRGIEDKGMREVEYNFARIFHQLGMSIGRFIGQIINDIEGLYSHAVKHYERVLDMADRAGVSLLQFFALDTHLLIALIAL